MSGEPKTLTPERFQHRHPVEAIRFTGANASDIYKFVGWEVPDGRVRLDNKAGVMRLWTLPPIHAGDWLVRRPQPLRKSEAACRPRRYVVYTDVDFHATFEPEGVPVVARDEAAEPRGIGWDDVTEEHVVGAFLDAQAEAHRYRNALEALLNSVHRGIYDAAWALEAVANAEALISPGLDDDYRKAKAQEAYERRLAGGESER